MKVICCGTSDQDPNTEQSAQIAQEMYHNDILSLIVSNINYIEFEGRKDLVQVFNNLVRRQIGTANSSRWPTIEHICQQHNHKILYTLMIG